MSKPIAPTSPLSRPAGRRRWTEVEKTHYLAAFAQSGLSVKAFCTQSGLAPTTFTLWRQQARMAAAKVTTPTPRARSAFAQVEVVASGRAAGITLVIRSGEDVALEFTGLDRTAAELLLTSALKHGQ